MTHVLNSFCLCPQSVVVDSVAVVCRRFPFPPGEYSPDLLLQTSGSACTGEDGGRGAIPSGYYMQPEFLQVCIVVGSGRCIPRCSVLRHDTPQDLPRNEIHANREQLWVIERIQELTLLVIWPVVRPYNNYFLNEVDNPIIIYLVLLHFRYISCCNKLLSFI